MALVDTLKAIFSSSKNNKSKGNPQLGAVKKAGDSALPLLQEWFPQGYEIGFNPGIGRLSENPYYSFIPSLLDERRGPRALFYYTITCENAGGDQVDGLKVRVSLTQGSLSAGRIPLRKRIVKLLEGLDEQNRVGDVIAEESNSDVCVKRFDLNNAETTDELFKSCLEKFMSHTDSVLSELGTAMEEEVKSLMLANHQVILRGAPGTGKTFMAKRIAEAVAGDKSRVTSVQFHPGFSYSDFVVGMKPALVNEDGRFINVQGQVVDAEGKVNAGEQPKGKVNAGEQPKGKIGVSFAWRDGVFKKVADRARKDLGNKYVVVIDEINRADLSRVFGELFSLIETEYRFKEGDNEKEKGINLPNGECFVLPANLYIVATMNDIDRSVESMDFALRRRFAWKEVRASDTVLPIFHAKGIVDTRPRLLHAFKWLNQRIVDKAEGGLGLKYDHQIGAAIFANIKKFGDDKGCYLSLWEGHIQTILQEYLRGNRAAEELMDSLEKGFLKECGVKEDE